MNKEEFIKAGYTVMDTENNDNKLLNFLKENYPSIIKDNEIDLNELKAIAGMPVDEKVNGYGLNFVGRNFARAKYAQKTDKELKLNTEFSKNIDTTQNLVLKGDNLDSLKILKSHYSGKIKMIYIDPPYNTDKDEFVYPDKFDKKELEVLGLQNLSEDDFARMDFSFKTKKSHNGWLSFMYPRLLLARDLLSQDGVIFISIDDNEQANLKLLCDDVFGEENFVGLIVVETANGVFGTRATGLNTTLVKTKDYALVYSKSNNARNFQPLYMPTNERFDSHFSIMLDNDLNKSSFLEYIKENEHVNKYFKKYGLKISLKNISKLMEIDNEFNDLIIYELAEKIYQDVDFSLNIPKETEELISAGQIVRYKDYIVFKTNNGSGKIRQLLPFKQTLRNTDEYKSEYRRSVAIGDLWEGFDNDMKNVLDEVEVPFDTPKPLRLIKQLAKFCKVSENQTVLDFFAGSGTTGHAVMQLNAEDGGNRKFILCQIDEPIKEDKPAYKFCVENNLPPVISSITIERLKRAGEKIKKEIEEENEKAGMFEEHKKQVPDIGFKVFDSVDAPKLELDETGQIKFPEIHTDTISRIYNMIFTVGLDEPTQVPEEVKKDCIYKISNNYYITNSEKLTSDDYANILKNEGKIFIDGWTASLNGTLQNYKEDVKIVF
jgi:adenine-specific DNA-methyltransferase